MCCVCAAGVALAVSAVQQRLRVLCVQLFLSCALLGSVQWGVSDTDKGLNGPQLKPMWLCCVSRRGDADSEVPKQETWPGCSVFSGSKQSYMNLMNVIRAALPPTLPVPGVHSQFLTGNTGEGRQGME